MNDLKEELIKANFDLKDKISVSVPFALEIGEYCRKQGALLALSDFRSIIEEEDNRHLRQKLIGKITNKIKELS